VLQKLPDHQQGLAETGRCLTYQSLLYS
jgi:hypothetical protein